MSDQIGGLLLKQQQDEESLVLALMHLVKGHISTILDPNTANPDRDLFRVPLKDADLKKRLVEWTKKTQSSGDSSMDSQLIENLQSALLS